MKKLIVLFLFIIGLLLQVTAKEKELTIIKIGRNFTIINYEDCGNSNYWSDKVKIVKTDTILPSDAEAKAMGIPDEEWFPFSEKVNGVYDSRAEKAQKKYLALKNNYQKLLKEKHNSENANETLQKEITILKAKGDSAEKHFKELAIEKEKIRNNYNQLFAKNTRLENYKNVLEIVSAILVIIIVLILLKIIRTNFQKKLQSAMM